MDRMGQRESGRNIRSETPDTLNLMVPKYNDHKLAGAERREWMGCWGLLG